MKSGKIDQLSIAMETLFRKEHQAISDILAQEAEIRGKLARLDAQRTENRANSNNSINVQTANAQFLWQGWTTRLQQQLNMELAQVMAAKLVALDRVRSAFGRQHAVSLLRLSERDNKKKQVTKQTEARIISGSQNRPTMYPDE